MTKDLEIGFDFSTKNLFVYSNNWKVRTLEYQGKTHAEVRTEMINNLSKMKFVRVTSEQKQQVKEELPSNKKVRQSKSESQLSKFIQVFSQLAEADLDDKGVPLSEIKNAMFKQKLVEKTAELNNLLNDALSQDYIEETEVMGRYRRRIKQ